MEGIAPSLNFCIYVRQGLEAGESIRQILGNYKKKESDLFAHAVALGLKPGMVHLDWSYLDDLNFTIYQRTLLELIERGLRGVPIGNTLLGLESEIRQACEGQLKEELSKLPFKMLIPLLFFQFPALAILFLGPFLRQLTSNF